MADHIGEHLDVARRGAGHLGFSTAPSAIAEDNETL
jgi:hypothetical protein